MLKNEILPGNKRQQGLHKNTIGKKEAAYDAVAAVAQLVLRPQLRPLK